MRGVHDEDYLEKSKLAIDSVIKLKQKLIE